MTIINSLNENYQSLKNELVQNLISSRFFNLTLCFLFISLHIFGEKFKKIIF